ncbi:hypothetical protein N8335_04490, partial [Amylibacter sp.]|nr:hypothetical protein [Amylibacter sp.]
ISLSKLLIILTWYLIVFSYTLIGLKSFPVDHVLRNSLFFYVIPLASLLNVASFVNKRYINTLIAIIVVQVLIVVMLDFLGIEVFRREGWFEKLFGYYTSGGTVVNNRFFNYKFTILLSLIFIRLKLQSEKMYAIDLLLIACAIILSGSKGIVLAALYPFFRLISFTSLKFNYKSLIVVVSAIFILANVFPLAHLIHAVFDQTDISNVTRLSVAVSLFDEGSILWGHGFGASLPPELIRDGTRPYGFEISYISYFHKMGIFFIILCFLIIILLGVEAILLTLPIWISALGNPTLTHLMNFLLVYLAVCIVKNTKKISV